MDVQNSKRRLALACLLWVAGAGSLADTMHPTRAQTRESTLAAGDHSFALQYGGRRRSYLVHVPRNGGTRARPVVLAFHGGGGEAEGFKDYAGLDAVADREGFIVAYPI